MDFSIEQDSGRYLALDHMRQQLQQLLGSADQLDELVVAAHLCQALEQTEAVISRIGTQGEPN